MQLKKCSILCLLLILLQTIPVFGSNLMNTASDAASALTLDAQSAILIDASTGTVLYEKDSDAKHYPASITKLMTVLLALEYGNLDETITFSHDAVFSIEPGSSHIAIDEGEQITMRQALNGIMLQSANEVSNGVAEHIDGSMEAFAQHMTTRAKELGCTGTNFTNANGLHDDNHYTTAHDMALIAKELLKFDFFRELMATLYYEIPPTNKQPETRYLYAQNQLIKDSSIFYYEYCEGGKTGYTTQAGNTLVAYAKKGDTELISVVLQSTGYGEYTDTITLFDYGFANFKTAEVLAEGDFFASIPVTTLNKKEEAEEIGTAMVVSQTPVLVTLPASASLEQLQITDTLPETLDAPVTAGQKLGTATILLQEEELGTIDLVAQDTVAVAAEAETLSDKNPVNFKLILLCLAILAVVFVIIRLIVGKIMYEKKKRRRRARRRRRLQELKEKNRLENSRTEINKE